MATTKTATNGGNTDAPKKRSHRKKPDTSSATGQNNQTANKQNRLIMQLGEYALQNLPQITGYLNFAALNFGNVGRTLDSTACQQMCSRLAEIGGIQPGVGWQAPGSQVLARGAGA